MLWCVEAVAQLAAVAGSPLDPAPIPQGERSLARQLPPTLPRLLTLLVTLHALLHALFVHLHVFL